MSVAASEPAAKPKIFISYGRGDDRIGPDDGDANYYYDPMRSFTKRLYEALTAAGLDVWWDRVSLPHRELSFLHDIRDAVNAHDKVLLVVGPKGMASDYVRAEYEYALSVCKPVVTILRDGEYGLIPTSLTHQNTLDYRDLAYFGTKTAELVSDLGAAAAPMGALHNVRRELPEWYVRRAEDLQSVAELLMQDGVKPVVVSSKHKTITLHGMGGIGKSTLANALALDCNIRRFFPDGVFWLELGTDPNLATRMGDIGEAFGDLRAEYPDDQRAASRLSQVLQDKAALIILDNVWDGAHAKPFKVVNSRCRLLITTRKPRMHTLLGGVEHELDTLNDSEAIQLFGKRLNMEVSAFTEEQAAWLKEINLQLGGLALAIEIAAGKISERGLNFAPRYLQRLQTTSDPFTELQLAEDDKDHNVALSLKLSYDDLSDDLKRRFRTLGIFAPEGTFDVAAAGAMWDDHDEYRVEDMLHELVQFSLVTRTELNGEARYFQHPLLRAHAKALLEPAGESEACFGRYADYVIEQSAQFYVLPLENWRQLDPILPHVDAVGDRLVERWDEATAPDETLVRRCGSFVWNVMRYISYRPQVVRTGNTVTPLRLNWLELGLAVWRHTGDQGREAAALNNIGGMWADLGEPQKALEYYEQALPLIRAVSNRSVEVTLLNNIGGMWADLGETRKALGYFEDALQISRAEKDPRGVAQSLNLIGVAWYSLGDTRKALECYEQALELKQKGGDLGGAAIVLNGIGVAWSALGEPRKALDHYELALPLCQAVRDQGGEAMTLNNIGEAWSALGEMRKALEYYEQALPLSRGVGDRGGEAATLANIASAWNVLGEKRKALEYYEQALLLNQAAGNRASEVATLNAIGYTWYGLDEKQTALEYYERALPLSLEAGDKDGEATACLNIALVYTSQRELDLAVGYMERCVLLDVQIKHPDLERHREILKRLRHERDEAVKGSRRWPWTRR